MAHLPFFFLFFVSYLFLFVFYFIAHCDLIDYLFRHQPKSRGGTTTWNIGPFYFYFSLHTCYHVLYM
jgi:hypothetical protein